MANENLSGAPEENNRELSQASDDSETWDAIISGKLTPKPATSFSGSPQPDQPTSALSDDDLEIDTEDYYNDRPMEEEPFYFDPDEEDISENFMKDPTDFTDVAGVAKNNRIIKVVSLALLVVAVIVGGGYFGLKAFTGSQDSHQRAADEANVQIQDPSTANTLAKPKRPLQELSAGAPAVSASKVTASVVGSTVVTSENVSLSVKSATLTGAQVACDTTLETDFCLAARGADATDATKNVDVYFFKDAAHSRIFENPANFNKVDVSGSLASASMEINLIAGKPTPVIVVVAANSSGFMIALPQGTTSDAAATFAANLSLS